MVLRKLFYPLSSVLIRSGIIAEKVVQKENRALSVDDLEQALELTDKEDLKDEKNMLEGIVRFGDETATEVMTSRQDVVDLDLSLPFPEVLKCIIENNYSRIPVYQDTIDNIRGILYIKDLLPHLSKPATFRWQSLIRPPYFVPETKKIDDLLRDFQENKVHIAIVVDEFGGTSGIITLEDILEEIVGEINDEYDEEEKSYTRINANTYIFEGKTLLSDFYKILDIDDETFEDVEGDADSLAGLLLEIKGDFPELHERLDYKNFTFEVTELDGHRISKIKVVIHENISSVLFICKVPKAQKFFRYFAKTSILAIFLPAVFAPVHAIIPLVVFYACIEFVVKIIVSLLREIHAQASPHSVVIRKTIKAIIKSIINCLPFGRYERVGHSLIICRQPLGIITY